MLPDGDMVHVQMNPSYGLFVGADWERDSILEAIKKNICEVGGKMCRNMNHGLVIYYEGKEKRPMFVATKEDFDFSPLLND